MTLQRLRYVTAVADTGAISKAAQKFYISQPSLTNSIHELEQELGLTIFHRTNRGVVLTPEGEFRRATWHLDFMWGFDGIDHKKTETGLLFHGEAAMINDTFLTGKIYLSGEHPFVAHFRFVKALEDENTVAKQTIPSPAQTFAQFWMPFSRSATLEYYRNFQK